MCRGGKKKSTSVNVTREGLVCFLLIRFIWIRLTTQVVFAQTPGLDDRSTGILKYNNSLLLSHAHTLAQVYKYINNWIWWRTSAKDKKVAPALIHDFVQVLWQCQIPVSLSLFLSLCLRSFIDRLSLFFLLFAP